MIDLDAYDGLSLHRYRVTMRFSRPLLVPAHHRAVLWRGAFGEVFRSLVCHDLSLDCRTCPLRTACSYPRVFAPSIPEGRPVIVRLKDPPRPFVLRDPCLGSPMVPAGEPVGLGLTLAGSAAAELPYFVVGLRRLGDDGIGHKRARFEVLEVCSMDASDRPGPKVLERGASAVSLARCPLRARDLMRPGDGAASKVRVRFLTPTDLRPGQAPSGTSSQSSGQSARNKAHSEAPSFGTLIRRARNRISALATFYGDAPLEQDARLIGELADRVRTTRAEIAPAEIVRRSTRTGQRHPIGGVVGSALYEGEEIGGLLPWLRIAEHIGVGKHATFGNGQIAVDVLA